MRYFVSGDTDRIPEHKGLACDVALVPIGGTFTMDADEAAELISALAPKVAAIPTHYGTIVGAPSDADRFAQLVDAYSRGAQDRLLSRPRHGYR